MDKGFGNHCMRMCTNLTMKTWYLIPNAFSTKKEILYVKFLSHSLISFDSTMSGNTIFFIYSFNLLKLPEYPTKEMLKERLNVALTCGSDIIDLT